MLKAKAYILLFVFIGTTLSSFASVHECAGEITDIDFLSVAECEHELDHTQSEAKEKEAVQSHSCCHPPSNEVNQCHNDENEDDGCGHASSDDCCSTTQLISIQSEIENEFEIQLSIEQIIILKSIYLEGLSIPESQLSPTSVGDYELQERDIFALFQVYII